MGWSRIPSCSWLVSDSNGVPRCSYGPMRDEVKVLEAARFTVFNQGFIDEAIANWRENSPQGTARGCSPRVCPSRWNRFLNSLYPSPRPARAVGVSSTALVESEKSCDCGALRTPVIGIDGTIGSICSGCLLSIPLDETQRV
jgi:hypothetical protein